MQDLNINNLQKTSAQLKRELKFSKNCGKRGFQERKKNQKRVCL